MPHRQSRRPFHRVDGNSYLPARGRRAATKFRRIPARRLPPPRSHARQARRTTLAHRFLLCDPADRPPRVLFPASPFRWITRVGTTMPGSVSSRTFSTTKSPTSVESTGFLPAPSRRRTELGGCGFSRQSFAKVGGAPPRIEQPQLVYRLRMVEVVDAFPAERRNHLARWACIPRWHLFRHDFRFVRDRRRRLSASGRTRHR